GLDGEDVLEHFAGRTSGKNGTTGQHLVEHTPERPDIRGPIGFLSFGLLRRHVADGAQEVAGPRHRHPRLRVRTGLVVVQNLRQAEVQHLGVALRRDLDVGRLQIAAVWGWLRDARTSASRSNRATRPASLENSRGKTLSATSRLSFESLARYTSPMPPDPRSDLTSY